MAPKRKKMTAAGTSKGQSSRRKSRAPTNPHGIQFVNADQQARYTLLLNRPMFCTKYIDEYALQTLGLLDDVMWMFQRVGWTKWVALRRPTYERITIEFLSSLDIEILQGKNCQEGSIKFRLFN